MDIESVAEHTPEKIFREHIHPTLGLQPFQTRKIAKLLGLSGPQIGAASKLFSAMFRLFIARDCSQIEVNPLVITKTGELLALDAKFNFDDNALYRQPEIVAMRDKGEEDPREVAASEFNLNYIGLDGNIACLVNGAGLAMATIWTDHPSTRAASRRISSTSAAALPRSRSPRRSRSSSAIRT